ncbi:tetratricopeptide repeat protein [Duganella qianjiadongensis]|uniref:Tetratricopeptide repeat protein n=1 Tax=Duganella qianjiadongensis TaxID=2692176 RepID=A0ABW9VK45_9BURK|nr:tetratricopeptide repeat protein [Duganella qianjiadongensis]MYM39025.1 tetratricopeptide repeat protein [Duganella qianjiadongensis]
MTSTDSALTASLLQQALAYHQQGQLREAQAYYRQVLALQPQQFDALHLLGVIARQQGDAAQAIELITQALALDPQQAKAHCNLGVALMDQGRPAEALASYERALALQADYAMAWSNRGNALRRLGQTEAALASYQQALQHQPRYVEAHSNRAIALQDLGRYMEALASAEAALNLNDRHADAWLARGHALHCLRWLAEAVESFDRALYLRPGWAEAYAAQGAALHRLGELAAALDSYDRALSINPGQPQWHTARGNTLRAMQRHDEAAQAYRSALDCGEQAETVAFALASVGAGAAPASLPADYVRNLFDQYANHFDEHLLKVLDYQTPAHLARLLAQHLPPDAALNILDLGCGTGLCAPALRPLARSLHGVDLSPQMLEKAAQRQLYDGLHCADLLAYMAGQSAAWDLAIAADVFVYIGDLAPVFAAISQALRTAGYFCFSVEAASSGDYRLQASNRYAHSLDYLTRLASASGLQLLASEQLTAREENGAPIAALALLLQKA